MSRDSSQRRLPSAEDTTDDRVKIPREEVDDQRAEEDVHSKLDIQMTIVRVSTYDRVERLEIVMET